MRLHAVVRTPLVQNMSFTAIGMPSSGSVSPAASRASAALAISRARSGVSSTKALSPRARSMAARCASASSTAVNSLRRNPSCAAAMVSVVRSVMCAVSLDHLGHDEIVAFARRRVLENGFRVTAVANDVGALLHGHRRHRGHRLDARYVDFTELLDESQNRVQLA